jgi:DNA-directed RNA polymerase subunit RPC12/RpoP
MPFERKAMRCANCGALIEIPSPEAQPEEIREKYLTIIAKINLPCPECGNYQAMVNETTTVIKKF